MGTGFYEAGGISLTGAIYASGAYSVSISPSPPSPASSTKYIDGQNSGTVTSSYTPSGATNLGTWPSVTTKNTATWPAPFSVADATAAASMPNGGNVPARASCTAGTGTTTYNSGTTTLVPGSYGDITISNANTVLVLDGQGDYFFQSLKFDSGCNNCKLQLGNSSTDYTGAVRPTTGNIGYNVAVCNGAFDMLSSAKVYKYDGTTLLPVADAEQLTVYVHGANPGACAANSGVNTCSVNMGNGAVFTGLLIVPQGTFGAANTATVNGAVWSTAVTTDTGFTLTQMSKADCESMITAGTCNTGTTCEEATVTTTGMCPSGIVGTVGSGTTGVQASNVNLVTTSMANIKCRLGSDCQTNMRCNNVATVATTGTCTGWDKCGTASLSAGATATACATDPCVQRITAAFPACTPTAWSATCAGYVPAYCDANCSSPTGTTTGTCVDNSTLSGTPEPGCTGTNGFDLAASYVCTQNTIPVCNHGSTAYSSATHGALTLSWWLLSNRQFPPLTTPSATATGSFTTSSAFTIAPGACTNIVVSAATTGVLMTAPSTNDYTIMVDPAWARPECGIASGNLGRRLDNWSWYNHAFSCTNTPNIAEYDYVADCSTLPDTYPRWKLLRWGAAPGAAQTVNFYAKVDTTAPACTGTSGGDPCASVAANTQTAVTFAAGGGNSPSISAMTPCALSTTSANCAVNLTTALSLSTSAVQARNLTVRVEWPAGVTTPTWDVTYTCEYDQ